MSPIKPSYTENVVPSSKTASAPSKSVSRRVEAKSPRTKKTANALSYPSPILQIPASASLAAIMSVKEAYIAQTRIGAKKQAISDNLAAATEVKPLHDEHKKKLAELKEKNRQSLEEIEIAYQMEVRAAQGRKDKARHAQSEYFDSAFSAEGKRFNEAVQPVEKRLKASLYMIESDAGRMIEAAENEVHEYAEAACVRAAAEKKAREAATEKAAEKVKTPAITESPASA